MGAAAAAASSSAAEDVTPSEESVAGKGRLSIIAVLTFGYMYYRVTGGSEALSAIGLVSFAGVAQVLPALIGVLFWRGGTRRGAICGLCTGFVVWSFTLLAPAVGLVSDAVHLNGVFGYGVLRPHAMMGLAGMDPLAHSVLWSLGLNLVAFVGVSLLTFPSPMERLQGASFVNVFEVACGQYSVNCLGNLCLKHITIIKHVFNNPSLKATFP